MREKQACCPNCDTVLALRYDPDEAEGMWHECALCGYRVPARDFRSVEAEDDHVHANRRSRAA